MSRCEGEAARKIAHPECWTTTAVATNADIPGLGLVDHWLRRVGSQSQLSCMIFQSVFEVGQEGASVTGGSTADDDFYRVQKNECVEQEAEILHVIEVKLQLPPSIVNA